MAATVVTTEKVVEPYLNPCLLDPRLDLKKGAYTVPMVYDWPSCMGAYPTGGTMARRLKTVYFDTRGFLPKPSDYAKSWDSVSATTAGGPPSGLKVEPSHVSIYESDYNSPFWKRYEKYRKSTLPRPRRDVKSQLGRVGNISVKQSVSLFE